MREIERNLLLGIQVPITPQGVIVVQRLAAILLLGGPIPRRMNWPL